jgi:osmotically-inducible protein OsmY
MTRIFTRKKVAGKITNTFATIGALALVTASTGVAATSPLRLHSEGRTDAVTAEQVYAVLNADPTYYFRHVDVYVRDGVATLSGYVWDPQDIYRARELTARVPGVVRVVDQMELGGRGRDKDPRDLGRL